MGPHDLQTQLLAVDFTYRTGPFRFSFIWSISSLSFGGRTIPVRNRLNEIARCPSTDHTDAARVHPPFLRGPVDKSVHRSMTGPRPPGNQQCPLVVVPAICLTENWPNNSWGARPLAYWYSDVLIFTTLHCLWSDSMSWRIWSSTFDTPAPIRLLESVTVPVESGRARSGFVQKWPKYLFLLAIVVS